jgi:D-3-phosphoglycerate dehydrogenase
VAEAIVDYLIQGEVRNAVNLPNMDSKTYCRVQPYLKLAEKLGRLVAQLSPKRNDRIVITYGGKVTEVPGDPLTRSVLKGFLQSAGGEGVNEVNVRTMAESLGLLVEEIKSNEKIDYSEWIHVSAHSGEEKISAGGTIFGARHEPRIVRVHSRPVEIIPDGVLLFYLNEDRPGIVGKLGTILGQFNVNIASMSLSRKTPGGQALTVLNLDSRPSAEAIAAIENEPSITNVQIVEL